MQRMVTPLLVAALLFAMKPAAAMAYIGPGVGAGAIAAVIGVIGSILLAIIAVVYYPIKRMLKGKTKTGNAVSGDKPAK
jgi:hypothetical protein